MWTKKEAVRTDQLWGWKRAAAIEIGGGGRGGGEVAKQITGKFQGHRNLPREHMVE